MPLSIKHPEADQLVRKASELTGLSLTDTVVRALRELLARESGKTRVSTLGEELRAISNRCAELPDLDTRTPEEIMGFDEHGLPA